MDNSQIENSIGQIRKRKKSFVIHMLQICYKYVNKYVTNMLHVIQLDLEQVKLNCVARIEYFFR